MKQGKDDELQRLSLKLDEMAAHVASILVKKTSAPNLNEQKFMAPETKEQRAVLATLGSFYVRVKRLMTFESLYARVIRWIGFIGMK